MLSAGAALSATRAVCTGEVNSAFVNARPPGHHAWTGGNSPEGYCFVNNVALAALYAKEQLDARKVLILDWDVHFGNGTHDIFAESDDVMVMSVHRYD